MSEEGLRYVVVLCKVRVLSVQRGIIGIKLTLEMPGGFKYMTDIPVRADVRVGDLLTLYTEVLRDEKDFENVPKGH